MYSSKLKTMKIAQDLIFATKVWLLSIAGRAICSVRIPVVPITGREFDDTMAVE